MWNLTLRDLISSFNHPSWGVAHADRVLSMSLYLAEMRNARVDHDALLCAAYLHDLGAIGAYRQAGKDHAERSAELVDEILQPLDFDPEKVPLVKEIIRHHPYQQPAGASVESILFRDADILEFLGCVGMMRMFAIVGIEAWAPDVPTALKLIRQFAQELPDRLTTREAKMLAALRVMEMHTFLENLADETADLTVL